MDFSVREIENNNFATKLTLHLVPKFFRTALLLFVHAFKPKRKILKSRGKNNHLRTQSRKKSNQDLKRVVEFYAAWLA